MVKNEEVLSCIVIHHFFSGSYRIVLPDEYVEIHCTVLDGIDNQKWI